MEWPKERELSVHDEHKCLDEWCYTCNESLSEEEYYKYWSSGSYNQAISQCQSAIEAITEEELLRVINNVSLLSVPISQERKLIAKDIRSFLLKKVGRV